MNKIIGLLATTIISAGLSFSASADKVTLKFHTFVPMPANSNAKFVKPWADKVTKESNGEIITEMYPSMQLGGKPPQLVDQVREGVEEWFEQGCKTPILVPSSTSGGQMHAIQEIFDAFS